MEAKDGGEESRMTIQTKFIGMQCDYCKRPSLMPVGSKDLCLLHLLQVLYEISESYVNPEEVNKAMCHLSNEEVEKLQ